MYEIVWIIAELSACFELNIVGRELSTTISKGSLCNLVLGEHWLHEQGSGGIVGIDGKVTAQSRAFVGGHTADFQSNVHDIEVRTSWINEEL